MAHFVKLHQLDLTHDNGKTYHEVLLNLDLVVSIEKSKIHSVLYTKNNANTGIRVKESLDEILKLSQNCCK